MSIMQVEACFCAFTAENLHAFLCFVATGFTTMCVRFMKSPLGCARAKVEHIYTGPVDTELAEAMFECDPDVSPQRSPSNLVCQVVSYFSRVSCMSFSILVCILLAILFVRASLSLTLLMVRDLSHFLLPLVIPAAKCFPDE